MVGRPTSPLCASSKDTHTSSGSLPLRREIRDLEAKFPDQFNLFVLGMRALQARPKEDPTSYYQIAGAFVPALFCPSLASSSPFPLLRPPPARLPM